MHERDVSTDFVLLVIKELVMSRATQARLILMSATLQAHDFAKYFGGVLQVRPADRLSEAEAIGPSAAPSPTAPDRSPSSPSPSAAPPANATSLDSGVAPAAPSAHAAAGPNASGPNAAAAADSVAPEAGPVAAAVAVAVACAAVAAGPAGPRVPLIEVEGRSYPVKDYYLEDVLRWTGVRWDFRAQGFGRPAGPVRFAVAVDEVVSAALGHVKEETYARARRALEDVLPQVTQRVGGGDVAVQALVQV